MPPNGMNLTSGITYQLKKSIQINKQSKSLQTHCLNKEIII